MPVHLPTFVVTAWLLAMLPGAGQALMLRQTLVHGRRAGWVAIAGTSTGLLLWSTAAAGGLSAVLLANPSAYHVLRIAGGALLVWLGVGTLRTIRRGHAAPALPANGGRGAFLAGLATNLGNPKAGVFAISLLPQFIEPPGPVLATGLALGALWALTTAAWYVVFVAIVDNARSLVGRPGTTAALQGVSGIVLIALGAGVALGV